MRRKITVKNAIHYRELYEATTYERGCGLCYLGGTFSGNMKYFYRKPGSSFFDVIREGIEMLIIYEDWESKTYKTNNNQI